MATWGLSDETSEIKIRVISNGFILTADGQEFCFLTKKSLLAFIAKELG